MSNFYTDNEDLRFHLENKDLERIVALKEDNFLEKEWCPYAPANTEDAIDSYHRVLEITGGIAGEYIAPRAPDIDIEGAQLVDGEVHLAKGTQEALEALKKADLMGFTLPRKYGGINMPKTVYSMATEMISRAEAGLMNLFGLQEIGDTIKQFGSQEQKDYFLPKFASGEVSGAMALTEPDAGSDLQAVMLKASMDEHGSWCLDGSKRFITNGCADVSLVLARSEDGTTSGKGLSLFIYEKDKDMKVRRIEHKLGINSSPTCEIQFKNAKAQLLGRRKFGLIKYTMSLMNGARLGVSAQAIGIAEAAYREAYKYANERSQFKKTIREFGPIYEMLTDMKISIEAGRTLLYETSRIVDVKEGVEERIEKHPETQGDLRGDLGRYSKLAAVFTPMLKAYTTEMSNKVCYDAIQVHGGVGYTKEFNVERHYRDARITNIYEGTTQLQVVAAIGGIMSGVLFERLNEYEENHNFEGLGKLWDSLKEIRNKLEVAVGHIKSKNHKIGQEFHAQRLVDMAAYVTNSYLLCIDSLKSERKRFVSELYIRKATNEISKAHGYILSDDYNMVELHSRIIDEN